MRVVNAMFGKGLGGIEQAFVDYCRALVLQGHQVLAVVHPKAKIRSFVQEISGVEVRCVSNVGAWDVLARWRLKKLLRQYGAEVAIVHGNRAASLMRGGARALGVKAVGVTHNYKIAPQVGLDGFFATTQDLRRYLLTLGQAEGSIHHIPNMIRLSEVRPQPHVRGAVPVIGAMGRFVEKKGFAVFVDALAILQERGVRFAARIGGDGEEKQALKAQIAERGLSQAVELTGWVADKAEFFGALDIFCLPSLHEPFGIILLEALAYQVPVVTADAEGPAEISTDGSDALIVPKGNALALADALQRLLEDAPLGERLVAEAGKTVRAYELEAVGEKMSVALKRVLASD